MFASVMRRMFGLPTSAILRRWLQKLKDGGRQLNPRQLAALEEDKPVAEDDLAAKASLLVDWMESKGHEAPTLAQLLVFVGECRAGFFSGYAVASFKGAVCFSAGYLTCVLFLRNDAD